MTLPSTPEETTGPGVRPEIIGAAHSTEMLGSRERGSTTVFMVALMQLLLLAGVVCWAIAVLVVDRQRVSNAADLAALAGAQVMVEPVPRDVVDEVAWRRSAACGRAGAIAGANGASLASCRIDDGDVIVEAWQPPAAAAMRALELLGHPISAVRQVARAGP